ncbi:hypothetical protein DSECCO2_363850 [anaerobic digester metagenome]
MKDGGDQLPLAIVKLVVQLFLLQRHPPVPAMMAFHRFAQHAPAMDRRLVKAHQRTAGAEHGGAVPIPEKGGTVNALLVGQAGQHQGPLP